jgi:hypothetical protein
MYHITHPYVKKIPYDIVYIINTKLSFPLKERFSAGTA